jgi:isoleucyl-tRNA synthetase
MFQFEAYHYIFVQFWHDLGIYEERARNNEGPSFIIHDGPPYANGDLHIGHAMNKILKDIINKFETLRGKKVVYVPGWDCHGLPIEMKVLQNISQTERKSLTPVQLRERAAAFAASTVEKQKRNFMRFGVWGDWSRPYLTMQPKYEAAQIRVFGEMFDKGYIYRGRKPVHWSPSSRTALAEAELEYPDGHVSQSVYVGFPIARLSTLLKEFLGSRSSEPTVLGVWTTTPWTLPANQAVAVNTNVDYCVVSHPQVLKGAAVVVAADLVPKLSEVLGLNESDCLKAVVSAIDGVSTTFKGVALMGTKYIHPLSRVIRGHDSWTCPVVSGDDYINTESGTGLVHTAPGHGHDDYITGSKNGLELLSPVDDSGIFTADAGRELAGLNVLGEGNAAVIDILEKLGILIKQHAYPHKYPYDWRTKKPTIFRVTEQWFASVSDFQKDSLAAIQSVKWLPPNGENRISKMVESRGDWCISRQRAWGVPIPVFYHKETGEPLITKDTVKYISDVFETEGGSDVWWTKEERDLLPPGKLRDDASNYVKGTDTMDVWFDSGTSWSGVLESNSSLKFPADLYLEGSDQHRGWFQSSLLTAVATRSQAPYKAVITHGFILDEKGEKMSKSLNNVVDPMTVINGVPSNAKVYPPYGADTLRLWVASVDYMNDACVGHNIIKQVSEVYRKLRNTLRYLLSNLNDFDPLKDAVDIGRMSSFDRYILGKLSKLMTQVGNSYDSYTFIQVYNALNQFAVRDLSNFYLDASKDRLYISSSNSWRRRSCQTVLAYLLEQMTVGLAPITPHLSEDVWQNLPYRKDRCTSVFQNIWASTVVPFPSHEERFWDKVSSIRNDVNRCIEKARNDKVIGASQEARVYLHSSDSDLQAALLKYRGNDLQVREDENHNLVDDLRFVFIVSQVNICSSADEVVAACPQYSAIRTATESGVTVGIVSAIGKKCERCWYYCGQVGVPYADQKGSTHFDLCARCANELNFSKS